MALDVAYRAARALEAAENYALADSPITPTTISDLPSRDNWSRHVNSDDHFWATVLEQPQRWWDTEFHLSNVTVSEWVPRVPGLYWSGAARAIRELAEGAVELRSHEWVVYRPLGKSQKVLGGVGTLKFPPDMYSFRLATLTGTGNASAGVPALISPEVWEHHRLGEGVVISANGKWQGMNLGWAERFPSIKGMPRGYITLLTPDQVRSNSQREIYPTRFHPCTVMEYEQGNTKLFDFVFATADTGLRDHRQRLERFFDEYKSRYGRFGRYLLSADIGDPLWEAEYDSPEALRRAEAGAESQLQILQARVRRVSFVGKSLEDIVELLTTNYDADSLQHLSTIISVPKAQWFSSGVATATLAVKLLDECLKRGKVEELLDAMAAEYPECFMHGG